MQSDGGRNNVEIDVRGSYSVLTPRNESMIGLRTSLLCPAEERQRAYDGGGRGGISMLILE